jgi:phospholipid/cholesterol/gamma-HCH transport system permease protein
MQFIDSGPDGASGTVTLRGDWTVDNATAIENEVSGRAAQATRIDAQSIGKLDTAGAWLIRKYFPRASYENLSRRHKDLLDFVPARETQPPAPEKSGRFVRAIETVGRKTIEYLHFLYDVFAFMGLIFTRIALNLRRPRAFRIAAITRHIYETGVTALPIIGLLAFGISLVIAYQGGFQLRKFGADIFTIDLTAVSLLREMAVLTTAIMFAGRSGSAFAAEIGVMKMRGEVDALRIMGFDPIETLVVPRLIAILITLPLLAFFADIVGLAGGGLMAMVQLDVTAGQYIDRVSSVATPTMFFIGMVKAPVFALLITAICTYQGMHAKGSAENVGKLTTLAVVQSIFLVIMADAFFSVIFSKVGI